MSILKAFMFGVFMKGILASNCDECGADASYLEQIITEGSYQRRAVTTTGCPNHYSVCTGKPGVPGCGDIGEAGTASEAKTSKSDDTTSGFNFIPAYPVLADDEPSCNSDGSGTRCIKCTMSDIAITLNGISIYSGAVNNECELLDVDDDSSEWTGFDMCSGHSEMTGSFFTSIIILL